MVRPETDAFLTTVEQSFQKKFQYRNEIGLLYECSFDRNMKQVFDDICFYAKFVSNAFAILKRTGGTTEDTEKLSNEFKESLEKVSTLIRTLIKEAPDETKQKFVQQFFSLSQENMSNFMLLLQELSRIKNYFLDKQHGQGV